jgi:hypothetical protein
MVVKRYYMFPILLAEGGGERAFRIFPSLAHFFALSDRILTPASIALSKRGGSWGTISSGNSTLYEYTLWIYKSGELGA